MNKTKLVVGILMVAAIYAAAEGVITTQSGHLILSPASGRVGIGTNSPDFAVDIRATNAGNLDPTLQLRNHGNGMNSAVGVRFYTKNNGNHANYITSKSRTTSGADLIFNLRHNGIYHDRMIIQSNGNVGVGTSSPSEKLEVRNPSGTAYIKVRGDVGSGLTRAGIIIDRTADYRGGGLWITASQGSDVTWYAGVPYQGNNYQIGLGARPEEAKLTVRDDGQVIVTNLAGIGNAYACVNSRGRLYRSTSPCT